jgi:diguanylate cyclase (GGDEF)-like protein
MNAVVALDFRTLSFVTLLFSFILGFGLVVFAIKHNRFRSLALVGSGFVIMGLGYVLLGMRHELPHFITIVIANSLIYLSLIMAYQGLFRFLNVSLPREKYLSRAGLLLLVFILSYFTYEAPNVNARIMGFSTCYALLCFIAGYGLMKSDRTFAPLPVQFLVATFISIGLFHVYRVILTSDAAPLFDFMKAGAIHAITVITSQFIVLFVTFMVIWIASDYLERELREMAKVDPLTKVYNRRVLEEFCHKELARAQRSGRVVAIVICDIDHFKQFNDRHGHQLGDRVLADFAGLLHSNVRTGDVVARYGGEEFVILLPETNCVQATDIAEKLRGRVLAHRVQQDSGEPLGLSASFGVACSDPTRDQTFDNILKAADEALYRAKAQGRNRVCLTTEVA